MACWDYLFSSRLLFLVAFNEIKWVQLYSKHYNKQVKLYYPFIVTEQIHFCHKMNQLLQRSVGIYLLEMASTCSLICAGVFFCCLFLYTVMYQVKCWAVIKAIHLTVVRRLPLEECHWTKIAIEYCWIEYQFFCCRNYCNSWKNVAVFCWKLEDLSEVFCFLSTFSLSIWQNLLFFPLKTGTCCDECYAVAMIIFQGKEVSKETFYPVPVFK